MEITKSPIELWVDALRSGGYKQGQKALHTTINKEDRFCCLGVACDLYLKNVGKIDVRKTNAGTYLYDGESGFLPDKVKHWLNLATPTGLLNDVPEDSLAKLNDNGANFQQIANIIEQGKVKMKGAA